MGGSQTHEPTVDPSFKMQKYLNQGLNQKQILMIRTAFESYEPQNGEISVQKYKECILQSEAKDSIGKQISNKDALTFDEFFSIEKEVLLTQLKNNPTIEIDSTQVPPPSNFFCPYAQEVVKN